MIVKIQDFYSFLHRCQEDSLGSFKSIILPKKSQHSDDDLFFTTLSKDNDYFLDSYRTVDPIRMLFYFPREIVLPAKKSKCKRLIVGAKGCDLRALEVLDKALINDDFVDPIYNFWRENTYIISSDCMTISPSCHCNLLGGKPYAEEGFDLNLSRMDDSYYITVGSSKGEELVLLIKEHVTVSEVSPNNIDGIKANRKLVEEKLRKQNKQYERTENYYDLRSVDIEKWIEASKSCIGCGGCTNICPTCYCMILNDETVTKDFVKVRSYDSCQLHGYARVAGGDTPRPKMYQRFRNRYLCKFDYMKSNFNLLGCTGCGRCIDTCPGKIEFRKVVQKMLELPQKRVSSSGIIIQESENV
ncbi:MAG: 4Fe-4S dicluster domain-containing protein [Candidatus Marinimicrobia bacterium]|nr:4Fe-4S dicluster domain-containing protein [Candidatus Neomarinimicrobiota bacterium]